MSCLDLSVLQQPVLPLDRSVSNSSLCCLWTCSSYSILCCLWKTCSMAAGAASGWSTATCMRLSYFRFSATLVVSVCLFNFSLCCARKDLWYSSLCNNLTYLSTRAFVVHISSWPQGCLCCPWKCMSSRAHDAPGGLWSPTEFVLGFFETFLQTGLGWTEKSSPLNWW